MQRRQVSCYSWSTVREFKVFQPGSRQTEAAKKDGKKEGTRPTEGRHGAPEWFQHRKRQSARDHGFRNNA